MPVLILAAFSLRSQYARQTLKSKEHDDFLNQLQTFAKKHKFPLDEVTPKINARKKKINCTLISSLGMVVPVENDIGYRPVQLTKGLTEDFSRKDSDCFHHLDQLKKACDQFCKGSSVHETQTAEDDLQHVITCIQFANDECDYGEGLGVQSQSLSLWLSETTFAHPQSLAVGLQATPS